VSHQFLIKALAVQLYGGGGPRLTVKSSIGSGALYIIISVSKVYVMTFLTIWTRPPSLTLTLASV
jgi:hypothetical protein